MYNRNETLSSAAPIGREAMNQVASGVLGQIDATIAKVSPNTARRIFQQIWGDVRSSALREAPWRLLGRRSVQLALLGWLTINTVLIALAGGHLPFHASSLADPPTMQAVLTADAMFVEVLVQMVVVHLLTRRRIVPNIAERAPATPLARTETVLLLAYGLAAMLGGFGLGHAFGWHAFSFHLDGMVIRTGQQVVPAEVYCWAAYNLIAYALLPLVVFRHRYTSEQLNLRSSTAHHHRRCTFSRSPGREFRYLPEHCSCHRLSTTANQERQPMPTCEAMLKPCSASGSRSP